MSSYFPVSYPNVIRIVGIDPGTSTLGFSVLDVNLDTRLVEVVFVKTLKSTKEVDLDHILTVNHGNRMVKIDFLYNAIYRLLWQFHPHMLIAEAPFMGRFAASYAALVEVRKGIIQAAADYNPGMFFETIEPLNVKAAVGVRLDKKTRKDKMAVKKAIATIPNLTWANGFSLDPLDEHSVDAIGVGYWKATQILGPM